MASYDNSNRPNQRPVNRSNAPRSEYGRPAASRPGTRPAGQRPAPRPAGARPGGNRPANGRPAPRPGAPRPQQRRRKRRVQKRFYAIVAVLIVLVVGLIVLIAKPGKKDAQTANTVVNAAETAVTAQATAEPTTVTAETDSATATDRSESLSAMLGDQDSDLEGLSSDELAQVDDLSVNQSLPSEWMNILLLGSDERTLTESARTDAMIICSINTTTGEVKLTSIMRDLAVDFDDIGTYNGTYRINAANYFGGERLAMKTVNECFGMNIQKYVRVNFYGFQQIAEMLGGIDVDITEEEMDEINYRVQEQWYDAYVEGIDESALPQNLLTTYGSNIHLDGRQTLAYARIRHTDGGDYARAERQRKVLNLLLDKLDGKGSADLLSIGLTAMQHMTTNLTIDEIVSVALKVLAADHSNIESFRLPVNNSYKQETRNEQDMLYDCDWATNASQLYTFIYG